MFYQEGEVLVGPQVAQLTIQGQYQLRQVEKVFVYSRTEASA